MPQVPKSVSDIARGDPSLLTENPSTRPDASSVLMASSIMAGMGRLGRGSGEAFRAPRRQKASKGSGRTHSMLK